MDNLSSRLKGRLAESGWLLGALDSLLDWRALSALVATVAATALAFSALSGLEAALAPRSAGLALAAGMLSTLICLMLLLLGCTSAGIMISDPIWDRAPRPLQETLRAAPRISARLLGVLLLEGMLFLAWVVLFGAVLLLCRIPVVGPLLYALLFPIGTMVTGVLVVLLLFVALPLAASALWRGATLVDAAETLVAAAAGDLPWLVVVSLLSGLVTIAAAAIVLVVVAAGIGITLWLSAAVAGANPGGLYGLLAEMRGNYAALPGGDGGYHYAFVFGGTALILLALVPPLLVAIKAAALIHRHGIAALDPARLRSWRAGPPRPEAPRPTAGR